MRPRMTTMKAIADHINSDRNINFKRKYSIIFVPRKVGNSFLFGEKKDIVFVCTCLYMLFAQAPGILNFSVDEKIISCTYNELFFP